MGATGTTFAAGTCSDTEAEAEAAEEEEAEAPNIKVPLITHCAWLAVSACARCCPLPLPLPLLAGQGQPGVS